jgi:hypothetical protein
MSVVVSETDATKPRRARAIDGVVVTMGIPAADAGLARACFGAMSSLVMDCCVRSLRPPVTCRPWLRPEPRRALSGRRYRTAP